MNHRSDTNPLALDPDTMRRLGYQAVDQLVASIADLENQPVVTANRDQPVLPDDVRTFSASGRDPQQLMAEVLPAIFGEAMRLIHPRFFAYIPGPANYISALADLLVSGHNVFAGTAPHNQGPFEIETTTIRWLCDLAGMGPKAGGLFVSGGSVATLTALAAARRIRLDDQIENAVVYQSDQTHSSVDRALYILGFKPEQTRVLGSDADCRIDLAQLRTAITDDLAGGRRPFCIIGNAGTTSSGAVDNLAALAEICASRKLWLHVDAAYGGGALLSAQRTQFAGIEHADSISIDPHKWLFQPYESACVLVRDPLWLRQTFGRVPAYMRDTDTGPEQTNFRDMSPQVTRAFKALKLWLSLQTFGVDAFRAAVEAGLETARMAERQLRATRDWQVVTPATLGIVTFRYTAPDLDDESADQLLTHVVHEVNAGGYAFVSSTELFGRRVMRLCPIHPGVSEDDIARTIEEMTNIARASLSRGR